MLSLGSSVQNKILFRPKRLGIKLKGQNGAYKYETKQIIVKTGYKRESRSHAVEEKMQEHESLRRDGQPSRWLDL